MNRYGIDLCFDEVRKLFGATNEIRAVFVFLQDPSHFCRVEPPVGCIDGLLTTSCTKKDFFLDLKHANNLNVYLLLFSLAASFVY